MNSKCNLSFPTYIKLTLKEFLLKLSSGSVILISINSEKNMILQNNIEGELLVMF